MAVGQLQEQLVETSSIKQHIATAGNTTSRPVILLHGLYDRWESWASVLPDLARHCRAIAPDLRGHARSDWPEQGYLLADYAGDVIALMDALNIQRSVLVGHSLGSLVAVWAASRHPDRIDAVILEDPPLEMGEEADQFLEYQLAIKRASPEEALQMVRALEFSADDDVNRTFVEWLRDASDGPALETLEQYRAGRRPDFIAALDQVQCPSLILQGDPNTGGMLSDDGAARGLEQLKHGSLKKFEGSSHFIHLDQSGEFVTAIAEYLQHRD